ncbi:MAG: pilin [Minisyncoccia bacterium]
MTYNLQPTTYNKVLMMLLVVSCWSLVGVSHVFAQPATEYQLLTPIPLGSTCQGNPGQVCKTNAKAYIEGFFVLMIMVAGGLAVLKIVVGGIKYMSTDAFSGKSEAKTTIENAIWGLLLAISAWLILNTINTGLTSFNLSVTPIAPPATSPGGGGGGGGGGGTPMTQQQIQADTAIRNQLTANIIAVPNGPCTQGQTTNCTNVNGLPRSAIDGLIALKKSCGSGCVVSVSGGTEGGHATHGPGLPQVDLSLKNSTLNSYIRTNDAGSANPNCGIRSAPRYKVGGATYVNEGDHWHVCY